jgi:hypothetical protein
MSIITKLKIETEFSKLEKNITKSKLLNDSLSFRIIIDDSIKILSSILKSIKNKNDLFGKNIAIELLIGILSFLPQYYIRTCETVCVSWLKILKSNMSKKILFSLIPKQLCYHTILNLEFYPKRLVKIKNYIYAINYENVCKIDTNNFGLFKDEYVYLYGKLISSNGNDIILINKFDHIDIISLIPHFHNRIEVKNCQGAAISENKRIYISTNKRFYVYDLFGDMINSWNLMDNSKENQKVRKIVINKNRIYMVDTAFSCVYIFSLEGKLITTIGKLGNEPGNFRNPWGITIYKNVVFIVDSGNYRIQVLNHYGKFLLEYKYDKLVDMADIVIDNDNIYVNDWKSTKIFIFKIKYDN